MKDYKISVCVTPNKHDNFSEPYFWSVLEWNKENATWVNAGHGWAKAVETAWKNAKKYYDNMMID